MKLQHVMIKHLKQGEYFKRFTSGKASKTVYIRGEYIREEKRYSCVKTTDVWGTDILLKGNIVVTTDFEY